MKRIISAVIILAMVISLFSMITFAAGNTTAPTLTQRGASIIVTNRTFRSSSPSQTITNSILNNGLGDYYFYAYVRLLETPDKPITFTLGIECMYTAASGETGTTWPGATATIDDTEWHKIGGRVELKVSTFGDVSTITQAKTFIQTLYAGMSSNDGSYTGSFELDAVVLYKANSDGTYSDNIILNPECNINSSGNTASWGSYGSFTKTNSLTIPVQEGGALHVEGRSGATAGPSQILTGRFENGTHYYSAYVRLTETPAEPIKISLGIELTLNGSGVSWPSVNGGGTTISDTEWHKISGTFTTNKVYDRAVTFINTVLVSNNKIGSKCNVEFDAVFLAKQDADGYYGENIINNPTMECDENGKTADWGSYSVSTITNTAYSPAAPDEDDGIVNADGSVTYESGNVPATDKNINYSGRFYTVNETSKQAAFESYVEIKFTGTSIASAAGSSGNVYYELDGVLSHTTSAVGGLNKIGLANGEHTLKIFATAQASRFTIAGFKLDKGAKTLPINQPKKIEFIGDSITEGYVDPADKLEDLPSNSYLNSYALKTGRLINAKYGWGFNTVAFGGIGMVLTSSPDPLTMGERYFTQREYIKATDGTTRETALAAAGVYDNNYVPDYIVINLGTNDSSKDNSTFIANYTKFINDLKAINPDVVIFCMTPFNGSKAIQIKMIVSQFDENVYLIDSATWGVPGGYDDLHPAPSGHDKATEKLFAVLDAYISDGTVPEVEPYVNAMQFNVTEDIYHAYPYFRTSAANATGLTASMADENGYITKHYTVYNVGKYDANIRIWLQTGYDDLIDSTTKVDRFIKKGQKADFTLEFKVDENGMATHKNGTKVDLSTLTFRTEIVHSISSEEIIPAGTSYIIVPKDSSDFAVLNISMKALSKGTNPRGGTTYSTIKELPTEKIAGATLDIGASLTLTYHARLWDNLDATLDVTRNGSTVTLIGTYDSATGYYTYEYTGINPQCMTDNISASLMAGNKLIASKEEYSVKAYANNLASKTAADLDLTAAKYTELITLLSDMLVYGKNSQDYMKYKQNDYATAGLTWLAPSEFTVPANVVRNVIKNDASNKVTGIGVRVENVVKIYFSVSLADDAEVFVDGTKAEIVDNKVFTNAIKATGFDDVHTVEIKLNGEVVSKVEYNVNAYINNKNTDASVGTIIKALSNYGASAVTYKN